MGFKSFKGKKQTVHSDIDLKGSRKWQNESKGWSSDIKEKEAWIVLIL